MVVCSGMNIAGMFHLSASIQRSVLYCLVSAVKLDRDHREVWILAYFISFWQTKVKQDAIELHKISLTMVNKLSAQ